MVSEVTLSADEQEVLNAIVGAPEAWSLWDDLAVRWPGVLDQLEQSGLVERWTRPDYLAATLTPWGAWVRGVWVRDRVHKVVHLVTPGRGQKPQERTVVELCPAWTGEDVDEVLDDRDPHSVPLLFPERVIDHRAPEPAVDDDGAPVQILGVPVAKDKRAGWGDAVRVKVAGVGLKGGVG